MSVTGGGINMEQWCFDTGKTQKPVPVLFCQPKIPSGLVWNWSCVCMMRGWKLVFGG
jgi:hypothetical protein